MNSQQLQQEIQKTQEQLQRLQEQLEVAKSITIETAQPGDTLPDGCIVVYRQENLVLIAAPKETEVVCKRDDIWERAFTELECQGFDMITWHIPSVNELKLASKYCPKEFQYGYIYWSSDFNAESHPLTVICNYGRPCIDSRDQSVSAYTFRVRAFKWVVL